MSTLVLNGHGHLGTGKMDHILLNLLSKVRTWGGTSFRNPLVNSRDRIRSLKLQNRSFTMAYSSLITTSLVCGRRRRYKLDQVSPTLLQIQNYNTFVIDTIRHVP